jgi:hypothetical protein
MVIRNCRAHLQGLVKRKDKAIPLQALTGPEVFRRLRLPDFKTIGTWRRHPQDIFLVFISVRD